MAHYTTHSATTNLQGRSTHAVRNEGGRFTTSPSLHEQLAQAHELAFENPLRAIEAFESGLTRVTTSAPVEPPRAVLPS